MPVWCDSSSFWEAVQSHFLGDPKFYSKLIWFVRHKTTRSCSEIQLLIHCLQILRIRPIWTHAFWRFSVNLSNVPTMLSKIFQCLDSVPSLSYCLESCNDLELQWLWNVPHPYFSDQNKGSRMLSAFMHTQGNRKQINLSRLSSSISHHGCFGQANSEAKSTWCVKKRNRSCLSALWMHKLEEGQCEYKCWAKFGR